ncbi:hypothetical protein [Baekduia sp.]|uniref:hypothetical protein n=1 Tax=Baekduia sp. TaxID=2600305 RepID=UPI002E0CD14F|nr:hypothetical protein [Baekduia sp.]
MSTSACATCGCSFSTRESDFRELVERITGRRVRAFVSGRDAAQDVSCEVFYLEPRNAG